MSEWRELIVGTLHIAPELEVFVNIVGALFLLEIASLCIAFLGGLRR